ncbi:MAG: recombinase family protein, partial [Defluviitaleaceae bacterium]|nr:recombinase family protein [Defluviitaleaceae bacterium]
HFDNPEFFVYEDEGFSGGNTDRPMFKQLIKDIAKKKFDVLVCYRLDRISRNVANFAETLEILEKHNVGFVSIKEQFNTTTPMGKAMMYISSVFAQLERDTIAERVSDNLSALAKTGRYLSGKTPQGYKKEERKTDEGKKYNILVIDDDEIGQIKDIFNKYLDWQSISRIEKDYAINDIRTRGGYRYKCVSFHRILTHPIYAAADRHTYEYFKQLGSQVYDEVEKWDGSKGIAVFRKTKHPPKDWLIGVGTHEPIISGAKWIQVQNIIDERKRHTRRRPIGKWGILSGVLRCKKCGDYMRPFCVKADDEKFYYICRTKEITKKHQCDTKNVRGDILDKDIVDTICNLLSSDAGLLEQLETKKVISLDKIEQSKKEATKHKQEISKNEAAIKNLVMKLAESKNPTISKYATKQIEDLDARNTFLRQELMRQEGQKDGLDDEIMNLEILREAADKIKASDFMGGDYAIRRNIIKTLVNKIEWNGESFAVTFN